MVGKGGHCGDDGRVGLRRRDHFEQPKVARRVEEVRAQPVAAEVVRAALGQRGDRDAGGVRADDRARPAHGIDPRQQIALDVQALDDGLENPIGVADALEVGVEARRCESARARRVRTADPASACARAPVPRARSWRPGRAAGPARRRWQNARQSGRPWCRRPAWPPSRFVARGRRSPEQTGERHASWQ